MDSLFMVNDDIDLSDDDFDIDFSKAKSSQMLSTKEKENIPQSFFTHNIPDTVPLPHAQNNSFTRSVNRSGKPNGQFVVFNNKPQHDQPGCVKPNDHQPENLFDNFDDDTDELMSQIDLPVTNNTSNNTSNNKQDTTSSSTKEEGSTLRYTAAPARNNPSNIRKDNDLVRNNRFNPISSGNGEPLGNGSSLFSPNSSPSPSSCETTATTKILPRPFLTSTTNNAMSSDYEQGQHSKDDETMTHNAPPLPHRRYSDTNSRVNNNRTPDVQGNSAKRKAFSDERTTIRKQPRRFPGPAGILPSLANAMTSFENLKSPETDDKGKRRLTPLKPQTPHDVMMTSSQDEDFLGVVWRDMLKQTCTLYPHIPKEPISKILQDATQNQLMNRKVVLLCGLIQRFSISGSGGRLVLKDPTGEINGTVHKNVLEEYEPDLRQGTGLILKDVSVFSPSVKKHYINITPSNIVQVYPGEIVEVLSTQTQSKRNTTPQMESDKSFEGKENSPSERIFNKNERKKKFVGSAGTVICNELEERGNLKSADLFGTGDSDESFFSDELCL